jgi:hypothetical protein
VGELIASEYVQIGKAIVDAHEMEKMQKWTGCWVSNKCTQYINMDELTVELVQYPIPLKNSTGGIQLAFNWVWSIISKRMINKCFSVEQVKNDIKFTRNRCFESSIREKQDNTDIFVDCVLSPSFLARYKDSLNIHDG